MLTTSTTVTTEISILIVASLTESRDSCLLDLTPSSSRPYLKLSYKWNEARPTVDFRQYGNPDAHDGRDYQ